MSGQSDRVPAARPAAEYSLTMTASKCRDLVKAMADELAARHPELMPTIKVIVEHHERGVSALLKGAISR